MKKIIRYLTLIIGSLIIALTFNILIIPNNLLSFGIDGIGALLYYVTGLSPSINILVINTIIILISSLFLKREHIEEYLLSSISIPIMIYITNIFTSNISFALPETVLTLIVSGFLTGYGYALLYKNGFKSGTSFLFEELISNLFKLPSKYYSLIIDILLIISMIFIFDYKIAFYSLFVILISRYLITKARFNINDSKMFYVITTKEDEVKDYIINDLGYELTELAVKGGFTKKDKSILLSVVSENDYYRLKTGITNIDPKAFIVITNTYDVINRKAIQ